MMAAVRGPFVAVATAALLVMPSCGKKAEEPEKTAPKPASVDPQGVTRDFCVVAVQLTVEAQSVASLTDALMRPAVVDMLAGLELIKGLGSSVRPGGATDCAAGVDRERGVGISLNMAVMVLDSEGRPVSPADLQGPGELSVVVAAHVERGGDDGRPEIGVSDLHAAVPITPRRVARAAEFARVRLIRAAAIATADALGQLAVRRATNDAIKKMLGSDIAWQQLGALREAGERGFVDALDDIHTLAASSRKDIALVAIATLGRLGKAESAPVLQRALEAGSLEIVDAALVALVDVGTEDALAVVKAVAARHPSGFVRKRARLLLERRGP